MTEPMNDEEKIRFVYELLAEVEAKLVEDIRANKVPISWGAIELRWNIEDRFHFQAVRFGRKTGRRREKYLEDISAKGIL